MVAADVLRSFRSKLPKGDSAASVAKQIFKQTDNPEDVIAKAETPENAGKTLTEIAPETKPLTDMAQVEVTNRQLQAQNKLLEAQQFNEAKETAEVINKTLVHLTIIRAYLNS